MEGAGAAGGSGTSGAMGNGDTSGGTSAPGAMGNVGDKWSKGSHSFFSDTLEVLVSEGEISPFQQAASSRLPTETFFGIPMHL